MTTLPDCDDITRFDGIYGRKIKSEVAALEQAFTFYQWTNCGAQRDWRASVPFKKADSQ